MATHGKLREFDPSQESWTSYSERLQHYFTANDIPNAKKKSILLTLVGPTTYTLTKNLCRPQTIDDKSYTDIVDLLEAHYCPKQSEIVQRYKFNSRNRRSGESIATYIAELRALGEHCNYTDLHVMLRDRLVCGVNNFNIQRRLLQEPDLTYKKALEIASAMEAASKHVSDIHPSPISRNPDIKKVETAQPSSVRACYRCGGTSHIATQCKFRDVNCRACGKKGHLAKVCRSKKPYQRKQLQQPEVHSVEKVHSQATSDVETVSDEKTHNLYQLKPDKSKPMKTTITVNNHNISMEVDTGASLSIISEETYTSHFGNCELLPSEVKLRTYSGEMLPVRGSLEVHVKYSSQEAVLPLIVVAGNGPSLLGRNWLSSIRLDWHNLLCVELDSSIDRLTKQYSTLFRDELGHLQGTKVKISIAANSQPKFYKARSVSYYVKEKVEKELERLQAQNIISPVTFSNWATPIVPVGKSDGSVRLCGDYKVTVNPVTKLDAYPLPKIDELFTSIAGGKLFSKLDLAHAYQQLELEDDSKSLTTINTHKGLFQYHRLPFGISSAPSIFQRTIETLLAGIPNVAIYLDDILVSGKTETEHLHTLEKVFERLSKAGLTLKLQKCQFGLKTVSYLGHVIDEQGLHPSPEKVEAIRNAPAPTNITELKSFLGLINYYHKFMPNLSGLLSPFYRLLQKNTKWVWATEHETVFTKVKELLESSSLLIHFDPTKELRIAADASPYGVGAVLSHHWNNSERPIMFASRTLSQAEQKYSQIEKEALAIVFAIKKFHQFIHGRSFLIQSDHKPLQYLFNENRQVPVMASARIQRWSLLLSMYNYKIAYKEGSTISHADALSRLPLRQASISSSVPEELNLLINHLSTSIVTADQIRKWTDSDPVLARVRRFVLSGWTVQDPEPDLKPYYNRRNELSTLDGCLLWGSRVIIPNKGQDIVLSQLHECHPGISRMKALAHNYVWWPNLDADIEQLVRTCHTCQMTRPTPAKAPLHPWEYPYRPWSRIHIDHAGPYLGHTYLIIVDAFSKWMECLIVPSTSTEATIRVLQAVFATHGIPEHLVSDNGTGFTSQEFAIFLQQNGIRHSRSSPYHPSSNGLAERAVQTMKQNIAKLEGPIQLRLNRFLLSYRTTPQSTTGLTPSELLMGRRLRNRLDFVHPDSTKRVVEKQGKLKSFSAPRRFEVGEPLYAKNYSGQDKWIPVRVKSINGPLSYEVMVENTGQILRRHVDQLRTRQAQVLPSKDDDIDFGPGVPSPTEISPPPDPVIHPPPVLRRSSRIRKPTDRFAPGISHLEREECGKHNNY